MNEPKPTDLVLSTTPIPPPGSLVLGGEAARKRERDAALGRIEVEDLGDGIPLEMVAIPGGTFLMGSPEGEGNDREQPQHEVTLPSFLMGKYPVTQAQWRAIASRSDLKGDRDLDPNPAYFKGSHRPVEQINWDDAVEFCRRLSKLTRREYRLPSEAEWEYACRAGTTTPSYFGETLMSKPANYNASIIYPGKSRGEDRREPTPVGQFLPNGFGLYDMYGNVWEWCEDDWHDNYKNAPTNGSAWLSGNKDTLKTRRGYTWNMNPRYWRSAYRYNCDREHRHGYLGFRIVGIAA